MLNTIIFYHIITRFLIRILIHFPLTNRHDIGIIGNGLKIWLIYTGPNNPIRSYAGLKGGE